MRKRRERHRPGSEGLGGRGRAAGLRAPRRPPKRGASERAASASALLASCLLASLAASCAPPRPASERSASASEELLSLEPEALVAGLPPGWEPFAFSKVPRPTLYDVASAGDERVLRARSQGGASALRRRVEVDPRRKPWLSWRWRVERLPRGADCRRRETDDCGARVLLVYRFDPERASFAERSRHALLGTLAGEPAPRAMLVYAWTSAIPEGTIFSSPVSDRVRVVAVRSGEAETGVWKRERRNHLEDYQKAFGEEPTTIEAVAWMADSDDTRSRAEAWLGELRFEKAR